MNKQEYLQRLQDKLGICLQIAKAKNSDYCGEGANSDPFKNFKLIENLGVCTAEQAILVRMSDKMARISTLLGQESKVKDESIEDSLIDLANYSLILSNLIESRKKEVK